MKALIAAYTNEFILCTGAVGLLALTIEERI